MDRPGDENKNNELGFAFSGRCRATKVVEAISSRPPNVRGGHFRHMLTIFAFIRVVVPGKGLTRKLLVLSVSFTANWTRMCCLLISIGRVTRDTPCHHSKLSSKRILNMQEGRRRRWCDCDRNKIHAALKCS